jgi:hypothetical protein
MHIRRRDLLTHLEVPMKSGLNRAGVPSGEQVSVAPPVRTARRRGKKPLVKVEIPALYSSPVGDRDQQGCMKARA